MFHSAVKYVSIPDTTTQGRQDRQEKKESENLNIISPTYVTEQLFFTTAHLK